MLPEHWDHERVTLELIRSSAMAEVWESVRPSPKPEDVVKLALGRGRVESLELKLSFSPWEAILAEMITSDALGADRMDYRILPPSPEEGSSGETDVGVYGDKIDGIAERLSGKGVASLERLATGLWVTNQGEEGASTESRAVQLQAIKRHVAYDDAIGAIEEIDWMLTR